MSAKSASPMGKLGKEKTKESSRQEALIAMQEAAMGMSQADGFQPGPMGVEGIVGHKLENAQENGVHGRY